MYVPISGGHESHDIVIDKLIDKTRPRDSFSEKINDDQGLFVLKTILLPSHHIIHSADALWML